jgi:hypothetical protein
VFCEDCILEFVEIDGVRCESHRAEFELVTDAVVDQDAGFDGGGSKFDSDTAAGFTTATLRRSEVTACQLGAVVLIFDATLCKSIPQLSKSSVMQGFFALEPGRGERGDQNRELDERCPTA